MASLRNVKKRYSPRIWGNKLFCFSLLFFLACLPRPAQADVYRWVDEKGRVAIGNVPPPGIAKDKIELIEASATPRPPRRGGKKAPNYQKSLPEAGRRTRTIEKPIKRPSLLASPATGESGAAPYIADLLALALAAIFAYRGYRRGTLPALLGALRVICAYAGAYFLAGPLGGVLHRLFGLLNIVALLVAGAVILLAVKILFRLLGRKIERIRKKRKKETPVGSLSLPDRIGGSLIGLLGGVATVLLLCWAYNLVRGGWADPRPPDISLSLTSRSSRYLIGRAAYAGLRASAKSPEKAGRIARLISQPGRTMGDFRRLTREPAVLQLLGSETFRAAFLSGDDLRILYNWDLQNLLHDEAAVRQLKNLAVIPDDYRSAEFQEKLAKSLARAGRRTQAALNDPRLHETVRELRNEGLLETGQLPKLILDPRFLKVIDRTIYRQDD